MELMVFMMDQLVVLATENNLNLFLTITETLKPDVLMKLLVIWPEILSVKLTKRNLRLLFLLLKTQKLRKFQYFKPQLLLDTPLFMLNLKIQRQRKFQFSKLLSLLDTLLSIEGLTNENVKLNQIQSTYRTLFFDVFEYLRLKIYSFTIFFFENSK